MFDRILRAARNDVSLYGELKGNPQFASESWVVLAISIAVGGVLAALLVMGNGIGPGIVQGVASVLGSLLGYFVLVILAWFIGTKLSKGTGTFTDVQTAVAYAYSIPTMLSPIPYVGLIASLWLLVTASSAIRETLGIGKGLTFFIVIISIVALFAITLSISAVVVAMAVAGTN